MATYEYSYNAAVSGYQYKLLDHQMYGMGRVGTYNVNEVLGSSQTQDTPANEPAKQFFEITDHLGSVRAVVSGVKQSNGNATIVQLTDYHEFGQTMQGRSFVSQDYRFGYQGSEKDGEVNSGMYTTSYRMLDVRLGRFFSPDPIIQPSWSPYTSMKDNPIALVDPLGLDPTEPPCGGPAPEPTTPDPYGGGASVDLPGAGSGSAYAPWSGGGAGGSGNVSNAGNFASIDFNTSAGQGSITYLKNIGNSEFPHYVIQNRNNDELQTFSPILINSIPVPTQEQSLAMQGTLSGYKPNTMQKIRDDIQSPSLLVRDPGSYIGLNFVYGIADQVKIWFSGLIFGANNATNLAHEGVSKRDFQSAFISSITMFIPEGTELDETKEIIHHIASDKHFSKYTKQFEEIIEPYGLKLDRAWNKMPVLKKFHYSRHPKEYHEFVLEGMKRAAAEAGSDTEKFFQLFKEYVVDPILENPNMLNKTGW